MSSANKTPSSVLIVGSGVFGLSTAYSLAQREEFKNTKITLADRSTFPAPDGSSIDTSRIIRSDYADVAYARLALEAQEKWRHEWWGKDVYHEPGLALVAKQDTSANAQLKASYNGQTYGQASLANGKKLGLREGTRSDGADLEVLPSQAAVSSVIHQPDGSPAGHCDSDHGYVNWRGGWADAEGGMRNLRAKLLATDRVDFICKQVQRLLYTPTSTGHRVTGVTFTDTTSLSADLTVLATGAWTPSLIDLRGIASATGQILTYTPISPSEQASLSSNPTILNESTGLFIIPPSHNLLKVARHGKGYINPVTIPYPEPPSVSTPESITVSLPQTTWDDPDSTQIPMEGQKACRDFLAAAFPSMADRKFTHGRICWYTDTRKADWIIDYHPKYEGLFVATGGSGHAYKFLPVVGDKIVDCIRGNRPEEFDRKWNWPDARAEEDHVWTEDWRGGGAGLVLREEMARTEVMANWL